MNCATFSLLEKPAEKKHLKDEKTKGNKGMKISANSNENANIRFFHGIRKRWVNFSQYVQVSQNGDFVQGMMAPLHVRNKDHISTSNLATAVPCL